MAARQEQTLQILSICLVGLVVVLAVALVMVNRWKADYRQQAEAAESQKRDIENDYRALLSTKEELLTMMGFGANDNLEAVKEQFAKDMEAYGGTFAETDRKYRVILEQLDAELDNSAEQESQAKKRLAEAEEQRKEELARKDLQIAQFNERMNEAQAKAATERAEFEQARATFDARRKELEQTLARSRSEARETIQDVQGQLETAQQTVQKQGESLEHLIAERKQEDPSFEVADGRVTWVNQANRTVWINLGDGDSLRPQITFSVYEQDLADAGKSEKKGSVEVVRILDDHLAEARITGDDIRNPIMPGDHIYSPVWHQGKQLHYALVGKIDVDNDTTNDIDLARDLIEMNGGVVDAYMTGEGEIVGETSVETRYLVIGDYPKSGAYRAAEQISAWKKLTDQAKVNGVETITLQEFLNQMGYRPLDRTVGLGRNARAEDFERQGPKPTFRTRSPYAQRAN